MVFPGAAAQLARELEELGEHGIAARSAGACLEIVSGHTGHRHDAGCAALGVSLSRISRQLRASRHSGAASLLQDAVDEAMGELGDGVFDWFPDGARDAWRAAIRSRIRPGDGRSR
ncbi:hypothetical protein FM113_01300 [Leucobacter sp. 7(1)]|uniref:hypothetical protein n=1 Tax=Leucobacter sp. 7(1) TaxID=1255613 RepID=UPI00097EA73D|nr:hypothetical protein [Leucobacter sp. 7(1)]SJN08182.1 hypothetical protein FM113_01300 [Leucobacter sp. 7(1)]